MGRRWNNFSLTLLIRFEIGENYLQNSDINWRKLLNELFHTRFYPTSSVRVVRKEHGVSRTGQLMRRRRPAGATGARVEVLAPRGEGAGRDIPLPNQGV